MACICLAFLLLLPLGSTHAGHAGSLYCPLLLICRDRKRLQFYTYRQRGDAASAGQYHRWIIVRVS